MRILWMRRGEERRGERRREERGGGGEERREGGGRGREGGRERGRRERGEPLSLGTSQAVDLALAPHSPIMVIGNSDRECSEEKRRETHILSLQGNGNDQNGEAQNAFSERSEHRPLGPPEALRPGASLSEKPL